METVEEEISSSSKLSSMRSYNHSDMIHIPKSISIYGGHNQSALDLKGRLMELELEKEESQKALELLKVLREQERTELRSGLEKAREAAGRQAEEVRTQMAERLEKQLQTIELLIRDKEQLQRVADERMHEAKSRQAAHDKEVAEAADKYRRELRKEREAWVASEKVRKDKWEQDKIREIREGTVQKLEPTIQGLIEKHKEELRRTEERTSGEVRRLREQLAEEYSLREQKVRERIVQEREETLEKERTKMQAKLHEQYERLEAQFNEERQRWKDQSGSEYDRLENLRRRDKDSLESQLQSQRL